MDGGHTAGLDSVPSITVEHYDISRIRSLQGHGRQRQRVERVSQASGDIPLEATACAGERCANSAHCQYSTREAVCWCGSIAERNDCSSTIEHVCRCCSPERLGVLMNAHEQENEVGRRLHLGRASGQTRNQP
jgi:hypothetical protein